MADKKTKQLIYYEVRTEALVPTIITYRVRAENENEALKQIDKTQPIKILPQLQKKRNLKVMVYLAGQSIIKLTKYFK